MYRTIVAHGAKRVARSKQANLTLPRFEHTMQTQNKNLTPGGKTMTDKQDITKVVFTNREGNRQAKCTLHYVEGLEPSQEEITLEDVHSGRARFQSATDGEQTYAVENGVKIVSLNTDLMRRYRDWEHFNAPVPGSRITGM